MFDPMEESAFREKKIRELFFYCVHIKFVNLSINIVLLEDETVLKFLRQSSILFFDRFQVPGKIFRKDRLFRFVVVRLF